MRYRVIAFFSIVLSILAPCGLAGAQDSPKNDVKGLFLLTDFPAVSVRPGTTSTVNLRLQNYALPPERLALSVAGVPQRLDRDPDRRRSADRGRDAGDQCQRLARASPRRAEGRPDRHHQPHGQRQGQRHQPRAADRGDAGQGPAGQAHGDAAASGAARQFEIDLRISAQHQERQRQEAHRRARRAGAAELRRHLHRAVRQPGAERGSDRCRPVEGRQAQGHAAEHGRRRQIQGHRAGRGRGRHRDHRSRPRDHRPAEARSRRPRRRALAPARPPARRPSIPIVLTNTGTRRPRTSTLSGTAPSGWKITFDPKTSTASRRTRTRKCRR